MKIQRSGATLGARVTDIDLATPLSDADFLTLAHAFADHGVLCFPNQPIEAAALSAFSQRFGSLQGMSAGVAKYSEPGFPEVSILSNVVENGQPIGMADAGQDWHTDMSYNRVMGYINVLVAKKVPVRNGKVLGGTEFTDTQAAYDDLPEDIKRRLDGASALHDWNNFHEIMRAKGSKRPPTTAAERAKRPPVSHPVFLTHPVSGRRIIYVNPGFTSCINGWNERESREMLDYLYEHIMKPQYRYLHEWAVDDVLAWDHLRTWHCAVADYTASEHRLMKRCQVLADKVFQPDFLPRIAA